MNEQQTSEAPWDILQLYFKNQHLKQLVRHQLDSYNEFVNQNIGKTINMFNPINVHSEHDFNILLNKPSLQLVITFTNFRIYRPQIHENSGATKVMFPQEARLRNFTYSSMMTVDLNITVIIRTGPTLENIREIHKTIPNAHIGKLPIMLRSDNCVLTQNNYVSHTETGECEFDAGGYFIINGSEKTVLAQERAAENRVYCHNISKSNTKWTWQAEVKSIPGDRNISPKQISILIASKDSGYGYGIYVQIPRIKQPIPLFVMFRVLGMISDEEICQKILLDSSAIENSVILSMLQASIIDANTILTQEDAFKLLTSNSMYIPVNMTTEQGKLKKSEFTKEIIKNDLFPHCRTIKTKIYFMGLMTKKLLRCSIGEITVDDRDSYLNKRVDTCGILLNNLFRNYFNKVVKDMQKQIAREINNGSWKSTSDYENIINMTNIYKIIKSSTIENGLKRALATGDFGVKSISTSKVGVAQVVSRLTYISCLSHLRRVNTPIDRSGKLIPPRKLNGTSFGFLCPAETPEGPSVGVVKNLSYMTHVTTTSDNLPVIKYITSHENSISLENEIDDKEMNRCVKVFVNGEWIVITQDPIKLYNELKKRKHNGTINVYTSIVFNYQQKEIHVCNDAGRLTRPVLRVKENKLLMTENIMGLIKNGDVKWDDLLTDMMFKDSLIEYIDPAEQNACILSMNWTDLKVANSLLKQYTYCEIHPSTIFGILASCIPFPDHNQSPRNTYQCAMGKQAMGVYVSNFNNRMDKTAFVLTYPMRPLVDTRVMNFIKLNNIPSGCSVIVAIMTHTGYNQEDSIIFNQGSVDRGLLQATVYHTEKDEDKKINGDQELRCVPDVKKTKGIKLGNYSKLNSKGVIPENTLVENRDIIISKVIPIKENRNDNTKVLKFEDHSRIYRTDEEVYIDKNYIDRNGDGYNFCKVRIRALRQPTIGDKFSSRHGQKGTIGNILPEEDMPYTSNGVRPDIIINPHAIPSRMTIAQLKETLLGKVILELGLFGDGSSFGDLTVETISNQLLNLGYEQNGNELMYDGLTGNQIETSIFMGPCFYQRLKHMVKDKQHSRSIGPMVNLTRQPAEGRSRDGGLRFGEMERDCMISHGASRFTKGRMYDCSDKFQVHVCNKCGLIVAYNDKAGIHICNNCNNKTDFSLVKLPYACKLLFHELMTMNIAPRLITNSN
jgi:DNA-directed RNA polymerase II subunit RPB2